MQLDPEILNQLINVLGTVLLALVTWGSAELTKLIRQKTKDGRTQNAFLLLNELAETVVARGVQTSVKEAKARAGDGRLSADDKRAILDRAVVDVREYLGKEGVKTLEKMVGTGKADKLIADTIERAVLHSKA